MNPAGYIQRWSKRRSALTAFLIAIAALGLDYLSKAWAQTVLPTGTVPILGDLLQLRLGCNTGIAFGLFAGGGWPLTVLISGTILVLAAWLFMSLKQGIPSRRVLPLGLILGGAVANLIDRVVDGKVTDFIDAGLGSTRWPTFNLADSLIVVGIGVLLWMTSGHKHGDKTEGHSPRTTHN